MDNKNLEKIPLSKEQELEKIKEQGFTFAGEESLTEFKFNKDSRFVAMQTRTKEEIIQKYIEKYKDELKIEVKLVHVDGLKENQKAVYVFIKIKDKKINN